MTTFHRLISTATIAAMSLMPLAAVAAPAIPNQVSPPPAGCTEQLIFSIVGGVITAYSATGAVLHTQATPKLTQNVTVTAPAGQEIHRLHALGIGGFSAVGVVRNGANQFVDKHLLHFKSQNFTGNPIHSRVYYNGKGATSLTFYKTLTHYIPSIPGQMVLQATFCPLNTEPNWVPGENSFSHPIMLPYDMPEGCTEHILMQRLGGASTLYQDIDGNVIYSTNQNKLPQDVTVNIPAGYRLYATDYLNWNAPGWFGALIKRSNNSLVDINSYLDVSGNGMRQVIGYDEPGALKIVFTKNTLLIQKIGHVQMYKVVLCPEAEV